MKNRKLDATMVFTFIFIPMLIILSIITIVPFVRDILNGNTKLYYTQDYMLMGMLVVISILAVIYFIYMITKMLTHPKFFHEKIVESTDERGVSITQKAVVSTFWIIWWFLCLGTAASILITFFGYYYWHLWDFEFIIRIWVTLIGTIIGISVIFSICRAYYKRVL